MIKATLISIPLEGRRADIVDEKFQYRAPLSLAISKDEGETWKKALDLEPSLDHTYCYTSITFKDNHIFFTYYYDFSHLKIKRLTLMTKYTLIFEP